MHSDESNRMTFNGDCNKLTPTTPHTLLHTARDLLKDITPMHSDCGKYCDSACCKPDAEGQGGMILFPGEENLYATCPDWATLSDYSLSNYSFGAMGERYTLLTCTGQCKRALRPLACRIFPLTPIIKKGRIEVSIDVRAWPICPLMRHGIAGLSPRFVQAVQEAMDALWQDEACSRYMITLSSYLKDYTKL